MIFLNNDVEPIIHIDKDLVVNYKHEGDLYLVSIQHDLTKQLVSYISYAELQRVDNAFFKIIKSLLEDAYTDISDVQNDYKVLVRKCDVFLNNCEGKVPETVYSNVKYNVECLKLLMQKLVYIVENICYSEDEE